MTTRSQQDDLVVFAAEAIVEAEWLRVLLDGHARRAVNGEAFAEEIARRNSLSYFGIDADFVGRSEETPFTHRGRSTYTGCPPHHVRATQRSPP